jgi:hypothetical protein
VELVLDLELDVEVILEEDDKTRDSDTQRTWPIERSQFASRLGLYA